MVRSEGFIIGKGPWPQLLHQAVSVSVLILQGQRHLAISVIE